MANHRVRTIQNKTNNAIWLKQVTAYGTFDLYYSSLFNSFVIENVTTGDEMNIPSWCTLA